MRSLDPEAFSTNVVDGAPLRQWRQWATFDRWEEPNREIGLRRRYGTRRLRLRQDQRPARRLPLGSRSQPTSRVHSDTSMMFNFGGCSRPLPSRSIGAIKRMRRIKALSLRWPARRGKAHLYRFPIKRPERSTNYRKEKQISSEHHFGRGLSLWP